MKKLFFLGALFAVGLGFTACSSDKDEVASASGQSENGGGNYIAISINLPTATESMTRAADTDNNDDVTFDDGLATEYAVNDATLLIFGSSGSFKEAYELVSSSSDWTKVTTSGTDYKNVTEYSKRFIVKTGNVAKNDLMLVVLNRQNLFTVTGTSVVIGGSAFSGTYSDFCNQTTTTAGLDASTMTTTGFYMANAPLANAAGSGSTLPSATVRVLVPISKVYDTQKDAEDAATVDQIYVERGMAKVTMDGTPTSSTFTNSKTTGSATINFSVSGWTLDNTNPTSYLVRSIDGDAGFQSLKSTKTGSVYRYIGNSKITIPSAQEYGYRTYFAKSYGYSAKKTLTQVTSISDFKATFGDEYPQYCFENTFPVSLQNINNTTLAQIEVTASVAGSTNLYTLNANTDLVFTDNEIIQKIQAAAAKYVNDNEATLVNVKGSGIQSTDFGVDVSKFVRDANGKITSVVVTYTPTSGYATLNEAAFIYDTEHSTYTNTLTPAICSALFGVITDQIYEYVGGKSYYYVRIKHFGDNLTPWNNGETPAPSSETAIYPETNQDNNYLGRYGVLRNNWYNIKIKSIKSLGSAVPYTVTYPGTPDDELDQYIAFQINVLSWAKRPTQNADL